MDGLNKIRTNIINYLSAGDERTRLVKRNIIYSFFNKGLAIIISLLIIPMTIKYVDASQYGIWLTLSSIVSWAAYFDLGFAHGFRNRFAEARANNDVVLAKKYVSTTYVILTVIFSLFFILLYVVNLFVDWESFLKLEMFLSINLSNVFLVLAFFFCIQLVLNTLPVLLLADQKPALSSMLNTAGQFFALITIYVLTKTSDTAYGDLMSLSFALSGIPCLSLFLISVLMYRGKYKKYSPSIRNVDFSLVRNIIGLGGKFFIIQISMLLIFQCTNIILSRIEGPQAVTEYNIAYKYFYVIYMITTVVLTPFWSAFTDAYTKKDLRWMGVMYRKLSRMWLLAIAGCVVMLIISPLVYDFWLNGAVEIPFTVSVVMGVYILIISRAGLYMQLINGTGKVFIQMLIYVFFSLVSIPTMIWACYNWGIVGMLMVLIIVYFFQCVFGHLQLQKILNNTACGIWNK